MCIYHEKPSPEQHQHRLAPGRVRATSLHFVSACKGWKACWGDRPSVTRAITSDTSIAQLRFSFDCGLTRSGKFSTACAASGRLDLLAHARASGYGSDEETCAAAAAAGSLPILEFLRANGCKWNDSAFLDAAEHGHLDVIKWLLLNGCPLRASNRFSVGAKAAGGGHLALLKWLVVDERLVKWDEAMSVYAAQNGHIAVLEWVKQRELPIEAAETYSFAADGGHNRTLFSGFVPTGFPSMNTFASEQLEGVTWPCCSG